MGIYFLNEQDLHTYFCRGVLQIEVFNFFLKD